MIFSYAMFLVGLIIISLQGCLSVSLETFPPQATVLPGHNVTFLCKTGVPLMYCRISVPGYKPLSLHEKSQPVQGLKYFGDGIRTGQCGVLIYSVEDMNNGNVECSVAPEADSSESSGTMQLTVAKAPKPPLLDVSKGTDSVSIYSENDMIYATCLVRDGRPAANITWFLDDEPVTEGLKMPTVIANNDLETTIQNLTRTLKPSDNGKRLRCVAEHLALTTNNRETFRQLDVKYAPLKIDNPIDKFGYELGKPGIISLEINANPKPKLIWYARDQVIEEGKYDSTGQLQAEPTKDMGRGKYIATLHIASIMKQDTETNFRLTAYNGQGKQNTEYIVIISTSPEPEGLELGVGYIVGIVVALLLLLFLIFLVIFARATGRWCFSGGAHVIDYTQGGPETGHAPQPPRGGVDNPHHDASQEYINGNDIKKKDEKIDTAV